jgi:hypothetical protein
MASSTTQVPTTAWLEFRNRWGGGGFSIAPPMSAIANAIGRPLTEMSPPRTAAGQAGDQR